MSTKKVDVDDSWANNLGALPPIARLALRRIYHEVLKACDERLFGSVSVQIPFADGQPTRAVVNAECVLKT